QTTTFGPLISKTFGDAPFALTGTASSGLTLTYASSNTAVATVSGSTVTIVGAGATNITASQAGDTDYNAAANVIQGLSVGKASQTTTFGPLISKTFGDAPFALTGTASSGLTLTYASSNSAVATVSGSTVTIVGAGSTNITASQAGDADYSAATNVIQGMSVGQPSTFGALTLITASPLSAVANGVDTIEITIQAIDNLGNNLTSGGIAIGLGQDGNATMQPVSDNGDGTYTAILTSTIAETLTVSGTIGGDTIIDTETITFTAGAPTTSQSTISATPSVVTADGTTSATITVQTVDSQGNNLSTGGANILVSTSGSGILSDVTDNSNGTYQATITNTVAETVIVSGTIEGFTIVDTSDVTFNPDAASATETIITVIPIVLIADGISTALVTIQTRDRFGNNLVNGGLTITLTQDGSAIFSPIIDRGDGSYTANITNTVAELITIGGAIGGIAIGNTDELLFITDNSSGSTTTITASPTTVAADGVSSSIITVQARDSENNNLSNGGNTIVLTENGSAIISTVNDNGDGTYSATVTDNVAEVITITGTINGSPITDSENIIFTFEASSAANSTLFASQSFVTANGVDTSLLTVQIYNAQGDLLTTGGDTIELSNDGDAIITSVIDQLNGSYTATISNTAVQSTLITATLNGIPISATETINFVSGGPAQINPTDGKFINGLGPLGSTIIIQDALGTTLCKSNTDALTGRYHCIITALVSHEQQLTVIATDLANNSESSTALIDSTDSDDDGISNIIENLITNGGGAANIEPYTDSDGDKLPDYAEVILDSSFLSIDSPVISGDFDIDLDGVTDAVEFYFNAAGGSINTQLSTDSDNDGIPDTTELVTPKSDFLQVDLPLENGSFDTDADTVTDAVEFYLSIFSIHNVDERSDYDRDGYGDALEVRLASDPLHANQPDIDNDGVNDAIEAYLTSTINDNSDTVLMDRDDDDLPDIFELTVTTNLIDPTDNINDGNSSDIDGDGLSDAIETYLTGNTLDALITDDFDSDGITDIDEISLGSNPSAHSKPVIWIDTKDLGNGTVEIYANLGGFQAPYPNVNWDTSDIQITSPAAIIGVTNKRSLMVSGLNEGKYTISLTLEQSIGTLTLSSSTSQSFSMTNAGFQDADFDGVTDGFDGFNGRLGLEETLQTAINLSETYLTQTQYSIGVRVGLIPRLGDNEISTISYNQLNDFIYQNFPITAGDKTQNENIETTPNLFDINIINIPTAGSTVDVIIPQNHPLSADAAVLIFNHSTLLWSFFESSPTDSVMSFMGSPGLCPAAGDASYSAGLSEGSYCLQLRITDGGINDQDNSLNGVIPLLTGIGSNNLFPDVFIPDQSLNDGLDNGLESGLDNSENNTSPETTDEQTPENDSPDAQQSRSSGGGGSLHPISLLIFTLLCLSCSLRSTAAPENGLITSGEGTIIDFPSLTTITQNTDQLSIQWDSFNIANGETVNFIQPDSSSIAINQDFSGSPSEIFGSINANGQIMLLNGAGILIGETGSINVGSFFASDLTPNTTDFSGNSISLSETNTLDGGIVNLGSIQTFTEGGVYIAGQFISNSGAIQSSNGDIHLAIADDLIVSTSTNGLLGVEVTSPLTTNISNSGALITNDGSVVAFNGNIYLDVFYSDTIKANTVNNTGIINAVEITQGTGIINLSANAVTITPTETTDIDSIISDSLPEDNSSPSSFVEIEISPQPKASLNAIMPECNNNDGAIKDCSKYKAIKRYLGRLLLGGRLPESTQ
ncbi:MAG: filamentous hemagglutinin N-terminal domain-containing protein, partial [Pseudomonadales bacterium]|nr:filamentous hemagglutinin N-terminal domain-containing protein [Pseudomonadales bacterium]